MQMTPQQRIALHIDSLDDDAQHTFTKALIVALNDDQDTTETILEDVLDGVYRHQQLQVDVRWLIRHLPDSFAHELIHSYDNAGAGTTTT